MGIIHVLPKIIQNQIAAGEVVERPASIVKELVENSLDAGATEISVEVIAGGIESILVVDNGSGMDEEDALLSLQRHATSKISTTDDLFSIHSYGFRGEALASISAVSHFTLSTRTSSNPSGIEIRAIEEEILSSTQKGLPKGTRILVEQLFFNTPARKKYLKSPQTEYSYILRLINELALSHPHASFTLTHNKKVTFVTRSSSSEDRMKEVLGKKFVEDSIPLFLESPHYAIQGRVSKPHAAKSTRKEQYIFVNGRPVQSDVISKAISEAFHRILVPGQYPAFVLHFTVDPTLVDVNVHPRKKEVKFADPQKVFLEVRRTVADSLQKHEVAPRVDITQATHSSSHSTTQTYGNPLSKATSPYAAHFTKSQNNSTPALFSFSTGTGTPRTQSPIAHFTKEHTTSYHKNTSPYTVIGQVHRCYIVAEGPEGFVLIDQHAAHERVLFDTLCNHSAEQDITTQQLLTPEIIELTPMEHAKLHEHLHDFEESGFILEDIGDGSISLSALPSQLHKKSLDNAVLIRNMLHEFEGLEGECSHSESLRSFREKVLAYTACRSAVKFGDVLSMQEMEHIVERLAHTERPDTCPHGRTSRVIITLDALKKLFDR